MHCQKEIGIGIPVGVTIALTVPFLFDNILFEEESLSKEIKHQSGGDRYEMTAVMRVSNQYCAKSAWFEHPIVLTDGLAVLMEEF